MSRRTRVCAVLTLSGSQVCMSVNPVDNAVTFVQCKKMQKIMKILLTKSFGYSYESPRQELSDEYPFAMVSVFFLGFLHHFVFAKLATSSIMVNLLEGATGGRTRRVVQYDAIMAPWVIWMRQNCHPQRRLHRFHRLHRLCRQHCRDTLPLATA